MAKIYGEIPSSALMTFDKSFARSNGQPLDSTEVFYSLEAAENYAKGDVAYVAQKIAVVETEDDVTTVTHYGIEPDGTLKELGAIPVGDGATIEVVDGKISIVGVNEVDDEGKPVLDSTKKYQPVLVNGKITWAEVSATTVEGLATEIDTINGEIDDLQAADTAMDGRVDALEASVGKAAEGDTPATGLVKEVADVKKDLADNYYDKDEVDAKVAGAFHFKGDATKLEDGKLYKDVDGTETEITDMQAGDVYQLGEVEYAYDGSEWVKLGFTLDLSSYATTKYVDDELADAKTELQTYADTAETDAVNSAKSYTDKTLEAYSNTEATQGLIDASATTLRGEIATAKTEAITEAGTNADTKIANKVGEIGNDVTVKKYVDDSIAGAGHATTTALEAVEKKIDDHVASIGDLATKNVVSLSDLNSEEGELKSVIEGKADKATTLEGYGITDAYTQKQIDDKDTAVANTAAQNLANKVGDIGDTTVKAYVDDKVGEIGDTDIKSYVDNKISTDIANAGHATTAQLTELSNAIDGKLTGKANATHEHTAAQITDLGTLATKNEVPYASLDANLKEIIDGKANTADLKALAKKDKVAETDLEEALATKINGKADKATTLAGYGITDAYTKTEADGKIAEAVGNAAHLKREIVDALPAAEDVDVNTIYMIPKETDDAGKVVGNVYNEYMWIASTNKWERIGDTAVDLTDYVTNTGDGSNLTVDFQSLSDGAPVFGEDLATIIGKLTYLYESMSSVAWSGKESDLELDTPRVIALQTTVSGETNELSAMTLYEDTYGLANGAYSIMSVTMYDSVTNEQIIGDVEINGDSATIKFTEVPTNPVTVNVLCHHIRDAAVMSL